MVCFILEIYLGKVKLTDFFTWKTEFVAESMCFEIACIFYVCGRYYYNTYSVAYGMYGWGSSDNSCQTCSATRGAF